MADLHNLQRFNRPVAMRAAISALEGVYGKGNVVRCRRFVRLYSIVGTQRIQTGRRTISGGKVLL